MSYVFKHTPAWMMRSSSCGRSCRNRNPQTLSLRDWFEIYGRGYIIYSVIIQPGHPVRNPTPKPPKLMLLHTFHFHFRCRRVLLLGRLRKARTFKAHRV